MSDIQNDKDFIEDRESLKDIEVPLRDQIDQKLLEKLKEEKYGVKLAESFATANSERSEWLKRRQVWLQDYDNFIPSESSPDSGSEEGMSNLHMPVAFTVVKTYHARILQALSLVEPRATARRPDSMEREQGITDVMKYTTKSYANCYEGMDSVLDTWVHLWCSEGVSTVKARWEKQYEKFVDVVVRPKVTNETVPTKFGEQMVPKVEQEEVEEERLLEIFNGPLVEHVNEEDIVIIGGNGDPQKADIVQEQRWLTASELFSLSDMKIFDAKAVEKVVDAGADSENGGDESGIKQDRIMKGGQTALTTRTDHDRYRILESYASKCVDKSGINSQIVVWSHPKTGEILRATYLRRINRDGKRPYFRAEFHRRHGSPYPMGLVEILYPVCKELDAMHNMRIDSGLISTLPFGFYRSGSSVDPKTIRYAPGDLIPVDDPQRDIYFPNLGNRTSFFLQEEQVLQTMVERLTGISDLSLGVHSGSQGATRTATGARALVGQANANLDVHIKRLFRVYRQLLRYILHMLQQRIPEGLAFRITGEDGKDYWAQIRNREDLAGDFDFDIDPLSADSDPGVRQDKATQVLNMVMNPLAIQLGAVTPVQIFNAMKNALQSFGVKDWAQYVVIPPKDMIIFTPAEEANRVLRGIDVPVAMNADHAGFIEYFEYLLSKPELLGSFQPEEIQALAAQAQKHQQMQQAMEQMQAQARNIGQMQQNGQQTVNQTAPGGNPFGGGVSA